MIEQIGFWVDKPKYKRTLFCVFGFHEASRYIIERKDGISYFVCKRCGKRFK